MGKHEIITQEHHRRPRSIGGKNTKANISNVKNRLHRAWHVLVGNKNAYQTCIFFNNVKYKPKNVNLVCKFINGSQVQGSGGNSSNNDTLISYAWITLFRGMSFKEIINYVNNVFLDPSYHIYIEYVTVSNV